MRAVLDTNVLISGLLWRGTPYRCLLAAEAGLFQLILAEPILDELRQKLIDKFQNTEEDAKAARVGLLRHAVLVSLSGRSGWIAADSDDDKFVEAALVANADVIVSGDRHLRDLPSVESIPILSPRQFLDRLTTPNGS